MVIPYLFILVSPLLAAVYHVSALHVGVRGELVPSHSTKRGHISGLDNGRNLNYMVNITLGGQPLQVLIDTGSSDLWVSETIVAAHDTGVLSGLTYAIGAVSGSIKTAQLEFLGYTVSDQAFLEVSPTSDVPPVPGMLGLGPNTGSGVHAALDNQSQGNAVLDRIFRQNVSTPNILTVLLGRSNDPMERYPGNITVGEILPGLESITSQPQVSVTSLPPLDSEDQHWQVLLDEDGIIGPDGKPIQIQTKVQSTSNPKQLTAVFDTGFSFPQVPQEVSDAIYSGIPGASFQFVNGVGQIWLIPCDAEVNLTFKIGGQMYPIHPLDTNSDDAWTTPDGHLCLGAFQPSSSSASGSYDMILGTSFLRNAYLLINFGDFVDGSVNTTADPYVQLLSITDPASAHADFISVRLNHAPPPPTSTLSNHAAVAAAAASGTTSSKPKNDIKSMFLKEKIPIIIALSIGIGLILLGVLVLCCTRNRLSRRGRDSLASTYKSYQHLGAPAPAGDTQPVQGYRLVPPPAHVNAGWGRR
ncbi:acid protease [Lactarius psammicola]|nr:acid protease [Lactarius psammicola]